MENDPSRRTRSLLALVVADIAMMTVSLDSNLVDHFEIYPTMPFIVGLVNLIMRGRRPEHSCIDALLVIIAFAASTVLFLYRPEWYHLFPYWAVFEKGIS